MVNNRLLITAVVLSILATGQAMAQRKNVVTNSTNGDSKQISLRSQESTTGNEDKRSSSMLVPEPTGLFALSTGVVGLVGLRRRRH
jgi:hypothetical protein